MICLTVAEVIELHEMVVAQSGGGMGIREMGEMGGLESAVAQPQVTFGGIDLYPTLEDKAASLAFSLVMNRPFVDGSKRIGHAAMETFLMLNGHEIDAGIDEQEDVFLKLAAGAFKQEVFTAWVTSHVVPKL